MSLLDDIDRAFDYRGDVTVVLYNGERIEGYLYNRVHDARPTPYIEMFPTDEPMPVTIPVDQIARIEFTGKDMAAGRSWEAWLKKVQKATAEGKVAEMYPELLD